MPGNLFTETRKVSNKLGKVMTEIANSWMAEVMKSESGRFIISEGRHLKRENSKKGFPVTEVVG